MVCCDPSVPTGQRQLRSDQIAAWLKTEWYPRFPGQALMTVWSTAACANDHVIRKLDPAPTFDGWRFDGYAEIECAVVERIDRRDYDGELGQRTGAFVYRFTPVAGGAAMEVLSVCAHYSEEGYDLMAVAAVPAAFVTVWKQFANECDRLAHAYEPENLVYVIGGRHDSFVPTVNWDEIVLPSALKADIMNDVESFFTKGVDVYRRLNLKPFRKLLLAGVPGTGKTMLCNALAKWSLIRSYLVIYVSSAQKARGDEYGSTFAKIQYALDVAANSRYPTLIILEELDAYLHANEKALILNVLDGSEGALNPHGTLMISTTNYPEAIDERILKRPGRLDRIFIIPQMQTTIDVELTLRRYLGAMWQDEHQGVIPRLVGSSGAFIREVAICALTQVAYDDLSSLSLATLEEAYERLKAQIDARDAFLQENGRVEEADREPPAPSLLSEQQAALQSLMKQMMNGYRR
jgi:hypothetical protein